jgi:hypothetical protein
MKKRKRKEVTFAKFSARECCPYNFVCSCSETSWRSSLLDVNTIVVPVSSPTGERSENSLSAEIKL